ncbi:unnamed protein product [Phytophthora fragariaefolia]|uniref:Unnamed protein product n=1 Tax=Phytophthora fragariaefolia TaxID=1490495 RepID=A0A9W7CWD9_9STRA|nr:unnamed protein product [Phytophthora fragariaefolia]
MRRKNAYPGLPHDWSTRGRAAPPTRDASPRVVRTPNPFPERPAGLLALRELSEPRDPPPGTVDSAMEESVGTNDLDEAQSHQVALELQCGIALSGFRPMLRTLAGSVVLANRDQECAEDTDPGVSIMSGWFGYFRI